ncbi:hypothetical protein L9F63_009686, partial [Diploptera punctata]
VQSDEDPKRDVRHSPFYNRMLSSALSSGGTVMNEEMIQYPEDMRSRFPYFYGMNNFPEKFLFGEDTGYPWWAGLRCNTGSNNRPNSMRDGFYMGPYSPECYSRSCDLRDKSNIIPKYRPNDVKNCMFRDIQNPSPSGCPGNGPQFEGHVQNCMFRDIQNPSSSGCSGYGPQFVGPYSPDYNVFLNLNRSPMPGEYSGFPGYSTYPEHYGYHPIVEGNMGDSGYYGLHGYPAFHSSARYPSVDTNEEMRSGFSNPAAIKNPTYFEYPTVMDTTLNRPTVVGPMMSTEYIPSFENLRFPPTSPIELMTSPMMTGSIKKCPMPNEFPCIQILPEDMEIQRPVTAQVKEIVQPMMANRIVPLSYPQEYRGFQDNSIERTGEIITKPVTDSQGISKYPFLQTYPGYIVQRAPTEIVEEMVMEPIISNPMITRNSHSQRYPAYTGLQGQVAELVEEIFTEPMTAPVMNRYSYIEVYPTYSELQSPVVGEILREPIMSSPISTGYPVELQGPLVQNVEQMIREPMMTNLLMAKHPFHQGYSGQSATMERVEEIVVEPMPSAPVMTRNPFTQGYPTYSDLQSPVVGEIVREPIMPSSIMGSGYPIGVQGPYLQNFEELVREILMANPSIAKYPFHQGNSGQSATMERVEEIFVEPMPSAPVMTRNPFTQGYPTHADLQSLVVGEIPREPIMPSSIMGSGYPIGVQGPYLQNLEELVREIVMTNPSIAKYPFHQEYSGQSATMERVEEIVVEPIPSAPVMTRNPFAQEYPTYSDLQSPVVGEIVREPIMPSSIMGSGYPIGVQGPFLQNIEDLLKEILMTNPSIAKYPFHQGYSGQSGIIERVEEIVVEPMPSAPVMSRNPLTQGYPTYSDLQSPVVGEIVRGPIMPSSIMGSGYPVGVQGPFLQNVEELLREILMTNPSIAKYPFHQGYSGQSATMERVEEIVIEPMPSAPVMSRNPFTQEYPTYSDLQSPVVGEIVRGPIIPSSIMGSGYPVGVQGPFLQNVEELLREILMTNPSIAKYPFHQGYSGESATMERVEEIVIEPMPSAPVMARNPFTQEYPTYSDLESPVVVEIVREPIMPSSIMGSGYPIGVQGPFLQNFEDLLKEILMTNPSIAKYPFHQGYSGQSATMERVEEIFVEPMPSTPVTTRNPFTQEYPTYSDLQSPVVVEIVREPGMPSSIMGSGYPIGVQGPFLQNFEDILKEILMANPSIAKYPFHQGNSGQSATMERVEEIFVEPMPSAPVMTRNPFTQGYPTHADLQSLVVGEIPREPIMHSSMMSTGHPIGVQGPFLQNVEELLREILITNPSIAKYPFHQGYSGQSAAMERVEEIFVEPMPSTPVMSTNPFTQGYPTHTEIQSPVVVEIFREPIMHSPIMNTGYPMGFQGPLVEKVEEIAMEPILLRPLMAQYPALQGYPGQPTVIEWVEEIIAEPMVRSPMIGKYPISQGYAVRTPFQDPGSESIEEMSMEPITKYPLVQAHSGYTGYEGQPTVVERVEEVIVEPARTSGYMGILGRRVMDIQM